MRVSEPIRENCVKEELNVYLYNMHKIIMHIGLWLYRIMVHLQLISQLNKELIYLTKLDYINF